MSRLTWDERPYEFGLERGVFYPKNSPGEAWHGLVNIQENPEGGESSFVYLDGVQTSYRRRPTSLNGLIVAHSYSPSFYEDVLTQRWAKPFGFSFRTESLPGYKIHLIYNVLVSPQVRLYKHNNVEMMRFEFTTLPLAVPGAVNSAHLIIDTSVAYSTAVEQLEDILYGTDTLSPRLPLPEEVFEIIEVNSILRVYDNGDGTFTVDGPDSAIEMLDSTTFQITWPSAIYLDADSYKISSL
jgi:hypothetical protein